MGDPVAAWAMGRTIFIVLVTAKESTHLYSCKKHGSNTIKLLRWSWRWFWRRKPKIYIGQLMVQEATGFQRVFEFGYQDGISASLKQELRDLFTMQKVAQRTEERAEDVVLDVIVTDFETGFLDLADIQGIPIPLAWRPKVSITARISRIGTNQPMKTYQLTQKQSWADFLAEPPPEPEFDLWSLSSNLPFDDYRLNRLLLIGCAELMRRIQKDWRKSRFDLA